MWTTLAFVAILSAAPGQTEQLKLINERSVHGLFGPERPDNKRLPGDVFLLVFDIDGLKPNKDAQVFYRMEMKVTNSQGKVIYGQSLPEDRRTDCTLGGTRVPASAHVEIPTDMEPGEYTLKVTVTDSRAKASQQLLRKFEVLPKDFALVRLHTTVDPNGQFPIQPSGLVGEFRWINFVAVGFERDENTKQPNVAVEMNILDENGKPVRDKPITGEAASNIPERFKHITMQFMLALHRPGKFTIELNAKDRVSKKTAKLSFPLTVTEQKAANALETK